MNETRQIENYCDIQSYKRRTDQIIRGLLKTIEKLGGDDLLNLLTADVKIPKELDDVDSTIKQDPLSRILFNEQLSSESKEAIYLMMEAIIELREAADYREKASQQKIALDAMTSLLAEAKAEYNSDKYTRSEERARAVVRCLGLTDGKRKSKTNKKNLFREYLSLISGEVNFETFESLNPLSQHEALEELSKRHGLSSEDSCLEQIRSFLSKKKKVAKKIEDQELENTKCLFEAIRLKDGRKARDLPPEELEEFNKAWSKCKKKLKESDWISKKYKGLLPGRNPYK